jgi:hypothetical protein
MWVLAAGGSSAGAGDTAKTAARTAPGGHNANGAQIEVRKHQRKFWINAWMALMDEFEEFMRKVSAPLTPEAEESLWLGLALVAKLVESPDRVLGIAVQNLRQLDRVQGGANPWLARWRTVLNSGVDAIIGVLTSRDINATRLRMNSPFDGVLSRAETERVMETYRQHRKQAHR